MTKISARQIATFVINQVKLNSYCYYSGGVIHFGCLTTCAKRFAKSYPAKHHTVKFGDRVFDVSDSVEIASVITSMYDIISEVKSDPDRCLQAIKNIDKYSHWLAQELIESLTAPAVESEQAAAAVETEQAAAAAVETEQAAASDVTAFVHNACRSFEQPLGIELVESAQHIAANFNHTNFDYADFIISSVNHDDDGLCTEICNEYPEAIVELCGYAADSLMDLVSEIEKGDIFIDDALAALYRTLKPCERFNDLCDDADMDATSIVYIRLLAVWRDYDECYPYRDIIRILAKGYDRTGVYSTRCLSRSDTARAAMLIL